MSATRGAIAITGASGLLGRHLRPALRDRQVTLLGRRRLELERHETWAPFDLRGPVDLPALPPGSALCHLAYAMADRESNIDYTRRAIDAVNRCSSIDHVVLLSSASVYGAAATGDIDEDTPLRPDYDYARTKAACEGAWLQLLRPDCRLAVLRPTSILAVDGPAIQVLARDAVHRPLRGTVKRALQHRSSVHFVAVDNVVAAVRFVLGRVGAAREVFVVSDDDAPENASYAAMQDFVRAALGRAPLRTLPLPRLLERPAGALLGKPLGVRRTFSAARLADAGFVRPTRLGAELARTVRTQSPQAFRSMPR
jgi:nucleoside-diphosphate-sugar epimerase